MCLTTSDILNLIQSASIVIASLVAIYGINSWRREGIWKRKYELAEETLSLFYDAQERLRIIRYIASYSSEGKTRKREEGEQREVSEMMDDAYVVRERYEKEKEPFVKLRTLKHRFIAVFGKEYTEPFDEVRKILNQIFLASDRFFRNRTQKQINTIITDAQRKRHLENLDKDKKILWDDGNESDEINIRMNKAIEKIEKQCNIVLRSQNII